MPFTCSICALDIVVGQAMLSDEKMNVAHTTCIERMLKDPAHPSINIPSVTISPLPPGPPSPLPAAPPPPKQAPVALDTRPTCPRCGGPLGPRLKGSYNHYPDTRFCDRCVRFIPEPPGSSSPPCDSSTWKPSPEIMRPGDRIVIVEPTNTVFTVTGRKPYKKPTVKSKRWDDRLGWVEMPDEPVKASSNGHKKKTKKKKGKGRR